MFLDATTLGQMVLSKEISPLELVEESIQKATLLNPSLNAIVYTQYEEAIENFLEARSFSLEVGNSTYEEDEKLAYCYEILGDNEKAKEYKK